MQYVAHLLIILPVESNPVDKDLYPNNGDTFYQGLNLLCGSYPSSRVFPLRLPSAPSSQRCPCLRLVLLVVFITVNTSRFSYRGLCPISSRPFRGYSGHSSGR